MFVMLIVNLITLVTLNNLISNSLVEQNPTRLLWSLTIVLALVGIFTSLAISKIIAQSITLPLEKVTEAVIHITQG